MYFPFPAQRKEFGEIWEDYLDLHTDYGAIKRSVDEEDAYLTEAVQKGWGYTDPAPGFMGNDRNYLFYPSRAIYRGSNR